MQNRGGKFCPKCGQSNPPEWHDEGECMAVIQEHMLGSVKRRPQRVEEMAENVSLDGVEEI